MALSRGDVDEAVLFAKVAETNVSLTFEVEPEPLRLYFITFLSRLQLLIVMQTVS